MYLKMISGTFPGRGICKGGKNWAILGHKMADFINNEYGICLSHVT